MDETEFAEMIRRDDAAKTAESAGAAKPSVVSSTQLPVSSASHQRWDDSDADLPNGSENSLSSVHSDDSMPHRAAELASGKRSLALAPDNGLASEELAAAAEPFSAADVADDGPPTPVTAEKTACTFGARGPKAHASVAGSESTAAPPSTTAEDPACLSTCFGTGERSKQRAVHDHVPPPVSPDSGAAAEGVEHSRPYEAAQGERRLGILKGRAADVAKPPCPPPAQGPGSGRKRRSGEAAGWEAEAESTPSSNGHNASVNKTGSDNVTNKEEEDEAEPGAQADDASTSHGTATEPGKEPSIARSGDEDHSLPQ